MDNSSEPASENTLVQPLFDGPLDIVGDVHGDSDALRHLIGHLGYDLAGQHPDGRRLMFVGDLTDRGPDSPGVIDLIQYLVQLGRAQCVLGNHDLNILLDRHKYENEWFFGEELMALTRQGRDISFRGSNERASPACLRRPPFRRPQSYSWRSASMGSMSAARMAG